MTTSFFRNVSSWVERMRWRHAALLLIGIFALANWQILTGRAIEKWDAYDLGTPYYSLLADFARAGRLLYWNPWVAGGSPDFAVAGSATFSPDLLLFAWITGPGGKGFLVYWLTTWVAGGFGILALARHMRSPVWGGLVVALGFTFSGFYTGHAEHPGLLYSYSLLPFIVWRLDVALLTHRLIPAAQAGVLWGLSGLAGYPAFTVYTVIVITLWTAARALFVTEDCQPAQWKRALIILILVGGVGVGILSPSYVSAAYEGRGYSDRSGPITREFATSSNALHPGALVTLGSPAYPELKLATNDLWSYTDVSCLSLYTGAAILLLAIVALCTGKAGGWRWFLLSAGLLALACAMSRALPFRGWLYDLVPPTRYFRHSGMLRGYFLFALSVLALCGARDLATRSMTAARMRVLALTVTGLALLAIGSYPVIALTADIRKTNWPFAALHLVAVWGGLLFLLGRTRLNSAKMRGLPAALTYLALIDVWATSQFGDATVIDKQRRPELPRPSTASIELGPQAFGRALGIWQSNVNLLSKIPTLRNYTPFKNEFHEQIAAVPPFSKMALGQNRVWFSERVPEVPPSGEAFVRFANRMWELQDPIFVRHSRAMMLDDHLQGESLEQIGSLPAARHVAMRVAEYEPEKLVINVIAPADGWIMVSERWSRSWEAAVNGVAQPVVGANFIFRALRVARGENHIEFSFKPKGLPALIFLSWGLLAGIACTTAYDLRFRRAAGQDLRQEIDLPSPIGMTA